MLPTNSLDIEISYDRIALVGKKVLAVKVPNCRANSSRKEGRAWFGQLPDRSQRMLVEPPPAPPLSGRGNEPPHSRLRGNYPVSRNFFTAAPAFRPNRPSRRGLLQIAA